MIIGCDFHTRYQQITMMEDSTGKLLERRLEHENGEGEAFYCGSPEPVQRDVLPFSAEFPRICLITRALTPLPNFPEVDLQLP